MSKKSTRRDERAIMEAEIASIIATNQIQPCGNWYSGLIDMVIALAIPIGFAGICLKLTPAFSTFSFFLYTFLILLTAYTVREVIYHAKHRCELIKVITGLPDKDNNRAFAEVAESFGFRIYDYSKYRTQDASKLKMVAYSGGGAKTPTHEVTALFSRDTIYLHVQSTLNGNENILFNRNKHIIKKFTEALSRQSTH